MTSLRAILANNIREKRNALGISQGKLAEKISTSSHYISQIEQKNKFPSPEMLERIAAALKEALSQSIETRSSELKP